MEYSGLKQGDLFIIGGDLDKPKLKLAESFVELRDEVEFPDDDAPEGQIDILTPAKVANSLGMSTAELSKITSEYL